MEVVHGLRLAEDVRRAVPEVEVEVQDAMSFRIETATLLKKQKPQVLPWLA
jgi:hypothetical protein